MTKLYGIVLNSIILLLATFIFPEGIQSDNIITTILAATIISICNYIAFSTLIGGLISYFTLALSNIIPIFGMIFAFFAIETLFLYIADWILPNFNINTFWWGMLVAIFLAFINGILDKNSDWPPILH